MHRVKQINDRTIDLAKWERVPFPSPLDRYVNVVYTVDSDAGTFTLSRWSPDGLRAPLAFEASLADICGTSSISIDSLQLKSRPSVPSFEQSYSQQFDLVDLKPLNIRAVLPTPMLELQQQFFIDFVFLWSSWV